MSSWTRVIAALVLISGSALVTSGTANAVPSSGTYGIHAGDDFLEEPDVATADNGDTVTVIATGVLDAAARTASGSGTFVHRNAAGTLLGSGTFALTGLTSFQFYGCVETIFCGGKALLPVHITGHPASGGTVELDGVLTVTCLVGSPPAGAREGIRLNVKDLINFNTSTEGETIYISH